MQVQADEKAAILAKILRSNENILAIDSRPEQDRPYSKRFKTVEAYENHKANSRLQDKKRRDKATAARNALNGIPSRDVLAHPAKLSVKAAHGKFATV